MRNDWLRVIGIGVIYPIAGIVTGELANAASAPRARFLWRLSGFAISGLVLAAHFAFERYRRRASPTRAAVVPAAAVAIGTFLLALAPNLRDLASAAGPRPRMLLALISWPLITAVPAFVVARIAAAILPAKGA